MLKTIKFETKMKPAAGGKFWGFGIFMILPPPVRGGSENKGGKIKGIHLIADAF